MHLFPVNFTDSDLGGDHNRFVNKCYRNSTGIIVIFNEKSVITCKNLAMALIGLRFRERIISMHSTGFLASQIGPKSGAAFYYRSRRERRISTWVFTK